ncbi:IscS subfamily cysteine desulfurase [Rossellomorea marisflavi]|uniref:IscS subfamily cysteine desulfurase n=1 Tax=Rossellomorea marisflavi TaxID=189381 RepID=UPI003D29327C
MDYFDYASTTPMDPHILDIYREVAEHFWGNPNSLHDTGGAAKELLHRCTDALATLLGVPAEGLTFTSGGSAGNAAALHALAHGRKHLGTHIIIGGAEHASLHTAAGQLESAGFQITAIPYEENGLLNLRQLKSAIREETILVSIAHCNGEIGAIQPMGEIRESLRGSAALLHSDLVQSFGKWSIEEAVRHADSFTLSSHKIHGPKGMGALYIDPSIALIPVHRTSGTPDLPGITAFTAAAERAVPMPDHYQMLRDSFFSSLDQKLGNRYRVFEGPPGQQLPQVIGLAIEGIEGQWLMLECNRRGMAISTGSACQSGMQGMPITLKSMGATERDGKEFIRISFGPSTTLEKIDRLTDTLAEVRLSISSGGVI